VIERFPRPPVIWPRFVTAWMPAQNAGARVAPVTNEVASTIGRDANKYELDEALATHPISAPADEHLSAARPVDVRSAPGNAGPKTQSDGS
jgi:hypothetical protein